MTGTPKNFNLLVEWTNACNIVCDICPIDGPDMRKTGHMSIELWGKILEDCVAHGHYVLWVHHLGEPLLWRHFEEGMAKWKESGLAGKGHISTNGLLLDEKKIEIIRKTGIGSLRICIDTLRPDIYKKIRRNDGHSTVVANAMAALERAPDLKIELQLMRTNLNADESPEDYFKVFGRPANMTVFHSTVMDVGKALDFAVLGGERPSPALCNKIDYQHCVVGWDGTVGLCCADYRLANRLGNLNDGSISEIFDGEYANRVRRMIKSGDFSLAPACLTCSMDHMKKPSRVLFGADGTSRQG
jgi:hypothetical protein